MTSPKKNTPKTPFPSELNDLNNLYLWQIWMLKVSGAQTLIFPFYSWVVPNESSNKGWKAEVVEPIDTQTNTEGKAVKIELLKAEYIGTGKSVKNYIDQLLMAIPLSEIVNDSDCSPVPNGFLNFNLGTELATVKNSYVVRPEVFLPAEHLLIPWHAKATPSPTDYSVFVNQLVRVNKLDLLSFGRSDFDKVVVKGLIRKVSEKMRGETGFDFTQSSAPRIGSIEWFRLPVSDFKLDSLVEFGCEKTSTGSVSSVNVFLDGLPLSIAEKAVLVRCRIINGEEVDKDEIKELNWGNEAQVIKFVPRVPVSEILVTLWEKDNTGNCHILFEKSANCMRMVNFEMSIIGTTINSGKISLLKKLRNAAEEKKAGDLGIFARSTKASSTTIGAYTDDSWVPSGRNAMDFMKSLYPNKSGGHFFLRGWDETKNATGHLSFIEWILELISVKNEGTLLLIDPFFDKDGIEIFAHARTTNNKYIILTCTQHRAREKELDVEEATMPLSSETADSIGLSVNTPNKTTRDLQEKCKDMLPLLSGLELQIMDIKSDGGGKDQLFHDRYVVLMDKEGYAFEGFHLSNSIQGATKTAPLLVTPIPADILDEVLQYIENLIEPKNPNPGSKKTSVETIYPLPVSKTEIINPGTLTDEVPSTRESGIVDKIPDMGYLFSILHSNAGLERMSSDELYDYLIEKDLLDTETGHSKVFNITTNQLTLFAEFLNDAGQEEFERLWKSLSTLKAHGSSYDHDKIIHNDPNPPILYDAWKELMSIISTLPNIEGKLLIYLEGFSTDKQLAHDDRQFSILNAESFEEVYRLAARTIDHFYSDTLNMDYGYRNAAKALVNEFSETAIQFLNRLLIVVSAAKWNEGNIHIRSKLQMISLLIRNLISYKNTTNTALLTKLLKDKNFALRALAAAAMKASLFDENRNMDLETIIVKLKETLPDEENRLAIAGMIARKHISPDTSVSASWKESLYPCLTTNWTSKGQLLKRVITILGGNLFFNHANEITRCFILPLCRNNSITPLEGYKAWHDVFLEKVRYREQYKDDGSESAPYNYCSTTDIELTQGLMKMFSQLDEGKQLAMISEWINVTDQLWPQVTMPFARHSNHNKHHMAATRIYWLMFIMRKLKRDGFLLPMALEQADKFIQDHSEEMLFVDQFVNNLNVYSIKDLNKIL
ncbi:MAG: VPA1262 family protein [Chitinophagaceae bacterium]|jgi:hypothetical protein